MYNDRLILVMVRPALVDAFDIQCNTYPTLSLLKGEQTGIEKCTFEPFVVVSGSSYTISLRTLDVSLGISHT